MEEKTMTVLTEEYLMEKIYIIRGVQVMLDADLAAALLKRPFDEVFG